MIDLAVSDMMMNCVTHGMGFARNVAHRLVFMDDKLIVESDPPLKFDSKPESETAKLFFNQVIFTGHSPE